MTSSLLDLMESSPSSGKTSPESSATNQTPLDVSWQALSERNTPSLSTEAGQARVWLMDHGHGPRGSFATLNISEWPNDGVAHVIDFGNCIDPAAVLFERKSGGRHSPPSREAGQNVAPTISARPSGGGGLGTDFDCDGGLIPDVARCLQAQAQLANLEDQDTLIPSHDPATTLTAREYKGALPEADLSTVVAHALRGEGFDASEDGTGRGTPLVPVAFDCKGTEVQTDETGVAPPLRSMGNTQSHQSAGGHATIAFDTTQVTSPGNYSSPKQGDPVHPLAAEAHPPAVAFDLRGRDGGAQPEGPHDTANIRAASGGSSRSYIATQWAVRRLTPTECARLQGGPDDHCNITYRGKPAADGPQYKAWGNSMAIPCVAWIMDRMRISMVEMEGAV